MTHQNIAIIGGGLTGKALAYALWVQGMRSIVLIDKAPPRSSATLCHENRRLAISGKNYQFLESLGLTRTWPLPPALLRIHVGQYGDEDALDFQHDGEPMGWMVPLSVLDEALTHALSDTDIVWYQQATPRTLKLEHDRWQVEGENLPALSSDLLIGADGRHSWLRTWMDVPTRTIDYHQTSLVFSVNHEEAHQNRAFEIFYPRGPLAVLPEHSPDQSSVIWTESSASSASLMALDDESFLAIFQKLFSRWGKLSNVSARMSYPLACVWPRRIVGRRWMLIGDAAHGLHPLAGQGFNLGLREIQIFLQHAIQHKSLGLDIGNETMLRQYKVEARSHAWAMVIATHGLHRCFQGPSPLWQSLRQTGMEILQRCSPLKKAITRYAS